MEIAFRSRMGDPDRIVGGFATGRIDSGPCSATMIGPNILMTAAHCGSPANALAEFYVYSQEDPNGKYFSRDGYNCEYLLNSWPETDLILWYCAPGHENVSPGDRYGYLDFDFAYGPDNKLDVAASRARVTPGKPIYSYWWNFFGGWPTNDVNMFYSAGTIRGSNLAGHWFNPGRVIASDPDLGQCGEGDDDLAAAMQADIYSHGGSSGSAMISGGHGLAGRRIISGPTSVAAPEGRARTMLPMIEYMASAVIQTPDKYPCKVTTASPMINGAYIASKFELASAAYRGLVDKDGNGVLDIQQDIEKKNGESKRPFYWFGFDSHRSNVLWTTLTGAEIRTQSGTAVLRRGGSGSLEHAKSPVLHLDPQRRYHVSWTLTSDRAVSICGGSCVTAGPTPSRSTMKRYAGEISGAEAIALRTQGMGTSTVGEVSLVEMGSTMDFDWADARSLWQSTINRVEGTTTPTFVQLGTEALSWPAADWAAVVSRGLYSLSSAHLPFSPGKTRVCLATRNNPLDPTSTGAWRLRVLDGGSERVSEVIAASSDWQQTCTSWFEMKSADGQLELGLEQGSATGKVGSYLVDDIVIEKS